MFAMGATIVNALTHKGVSEEYFARCDENLLASIAAEDEEPAAEEQEEQFF